MVNTMPRCADGVAGICGQRLRRSSPPAANAYAPPPSAPPVFTPFTRLVPTTHHPSVVSYRHLPLLYRRRHPIRRAVGVTPGNAGAISRGGGVEVGGEAGGGKRGEKERERAPPHSSNHHHRQNPPGLTGRAITATASSADRLKLKHRQRHRRFLERRPPHCSRAPPLWAAPPPRCCRVAARNGAAGCPVGSSPTETGPTMDGRGGSNRSRG